MSRALARRVEPSASPAPPPQPAACRRSPATHPTLTHRWCGQYRMRDPGPCLGLGYELRTVSRVPNLPAQLGEPVTNLIRPREVLGGPSCLPLLQEPLCFVVGLST